MADYDITKYKESYSADVDRLCHAFSHESLKEYGQSISTKKLWRDIADKCREYSFFLVHDGRAVGVITGLLGSSLPNDGLVLQELMWYVYPEHRKHGLKLLKSFEDEGRKVGAKMVVMALMHNSDTERIDRLYKRRGYRPFETHYLKELS